MEMEGGVVSNCLMEVERWYVIYDGVEEVISNFLTEVGICFPISGRMFKGFFQFSDAGGEVVSKYMLKVCRWFHISKLR